MNDTMTVVFACDNNYAKFLGVAIASLVDNFSKDKSLEIIVFNSGINDENKSIIKKIAKNNIDIVFIDIDESIFKDYPLTIEHISLATYFRLKLPSLLPKHSKVIYLDVDVLIGSDLSPIWDINIENYALGAVIEPVLSLKNKQYMEKIGIKNLDCFYFNAGSLIINLDYLRHIDFENSVVDYLSEFSGVIQYQDQDILNGILHDHVLYISPRYNFMPMYRTILSRKKKDMIDLLPYTLNEIKNLKKTAAVYHYCGKRKAWMSTCTHYGFNLYKKYLRVTDWKDQDYSDKGTVPFFRQIGLFFKRLKVRLSETL